MSEAASTSPVESCQSCGSQGEHLPDPPSRLALGLLGPLPRPQGAQIPWPWYSIQLALGRMPNTGKSTLFNRLTSGHVQIATALA